MAIQNIIRKAEQEYPPSLKQEVDPIAGADLNLLSGYINSTASNIVFTTGNQIKSGRLIIGNDANSIVDPNSQYTLSLQTNSPATWLEILNNSGVDRGVFFGIQDNDFEQYNWQGGDIRFFTSKNPGDGTERLIIKNDGKIGIDTHSPSEKLEVAGNIKASGASFNTRPTVNGTGVILNGEGIDANQISDSTSFGRTLLTAATVQAQRTALDIFSTVTNFETLTGTSGNFQRVYVTNNDGRIYVWNGVGYTEVSRTPTGELDNRYTQNFGNVSGIRAMTTGQYNAITPISGVVYILT